MAKRTKKTRAGQATPAASDEPVVTIAGPEPSDDAAPVVEDAAPAPDAAPASDPDAAADLAVDAVPEATDGDTSVALADVPGLSMTLAAEAPAADGETEPDGVSAELRAIVEAMIFASPEPLTAKALYKLLDSEPKEDVQRALEALRHDYAEGRGLQLVEIAGGFQIVTRTDLHEWVRRLFHERKSTKLSVQALESLAVIAYRQPVTSAEITEIRGVNASGVLATLIERKLVKIVGRKAVVGRPFLYGTTREFLMRFGLNDLSDLPKVEDMADVLGFDLQGMLGEPTPSDQLLPLDVAADEPGPGADAPAPAADEPSPEAAAAAQAEDAAAEAAAEAVAREELEQPQPDESEATLDAPEEPLDEPEP